MLLALLLAGIHLLQMKKWERQRVRFLAGSQTCPGCRARLVFEVVTPTGEWPQNDSQACIFEESPHDDSSSGGKKRVAYSKRKDSLQSSTTELHFQSFTAVTNQDRHQIT